MGTAVAQEAAAYADRIKIVSGIARDETGRRIAGTNATVYSENDLKSALEQADFTMHFSSPQADEALVPRIAALGKNMVVGTTGFSEHQMNAIRAAIEENKVSAVIAPNYSPLVNAQFILAKRAAEILAPLGYEFGVVEEHHSGKKDSPSGTAKKIAKAVAEASGGKTLRYRAEEVKQKEKNELDMGVLRLGGTPGLHELRVVGAHGRLTIESLMYSRLDFAKGALEALLWLSRNKQPGRIFGMENVLGLE
jgi:4-hydroxy-tetrahydrodipicolinate reductase